MSTVCIITQPCHGFTINELMDSQLGSRFHRLSNSLEPKVEHMILFMRLCVKEEMNSVSCLEVFIMNLEARHLS